MEVKIGIQQAVRELVVDTDSSPDDVAQLVADAVANDGVLTLKDTKGRTIIVPSAKLAYVEIGTSALGTVGFRS
ncbi:DUF3107 domain-containing protein [Nocardioides sp. TRM66260-LWL]|uniref:DUF3107 domain-containing protein n=1 Tax=Nocardioides sp. TRM66260-LWL TaxID=2874478 RepID=UPI001CC438F9|nr:DUF3107 domain-containing protein [Nocardioides sp. TRM66260-LWL]MBZ5734177.1 DUF3107 domain-containing protein [Nocardioides sp. TRM66260-LWL]